MQILGKRSKVLLIAVAIVMLVAIGVSFATWDVTAVKAINGDLSPYANAKVGDIIKFGKYYQTGNRVGGVVDAEYEKTAIEWIVVDKDERTGQLTLLSKYILAEGSFFGNFYFNKNGTQGYHYGNKVELNNNSYNQAYVDSTLRAYLNNLERLDLGGDAFSATAGYIPSAITSTYDKTENEVFTKGTGLLSSIGFSNQKHSTNLKSTEAGVDKLLVDPKTGFTKKTDSNEVYYQRPINNEAYQNRPATIGFYDEAFEDEEKAMIVPKVIAGYTGHRWPDTELDISSQSYVEGAVDKVWIPSATELNVINGQDWNKDLNDAWTTPSDEAGSTVFEYFKNYKDYGFSSVAEAIKTTRTTFAENGYAMNYSIPVYNKGTTTENVNIHESLNSSSHYWTRSSSTQWFASMRTVTDLGLFGIRSSDISYIGVRPCVILKY